jgi:hypothetical protein
MYKVGEVYIWQNQVGELTYLNETETIIIQGPHPFYREDKNEIVDGWDTDSPLPNSAPPDFVMVAFEGDLRPKDPPRGERSILELFKQPEVETA